MLSRQTVTQEELGLLIGHAPVPASSFAPSGGHILRLLDEGFLEERKNGIGLSRKGRDFIGRVHAAAANTEVCATNDQQETSSEHRTC